MHHPKFVTPDLTTFCRLDELGLQAVGQLLEADRAVLECRVVEDGPWCRKCGAEGVPRDTVTRPLAHEPFGHRPTTLLVWVRRYRCTHCRRTWRQDTSKAAVPREKISRGGIGWALTAIVVDHLTVSRAAAGLGVSWHTANTAIIAEGKRRLIDDPWTEDLLPLVDDPSDPLGVLDLKTHTAMETAGVDRLAALYTAIDAVRNDSLLIY